MLQGKALNEVASKNCKVMVVGNPCNTNALIAMENAPNIPRKNFHALTRLDENRAKCQLALKSGKFYTNISRVSIWGNHSTTQVPDFINARIGGRPAIDVIQVGPGTPRGGTVCVLGGGATLSPSSSTSRVGLGVWACGRLGKWSCVNTTVVHSRLVIMDSLQVVLITLRCTFCSRLHQ